MPRFAWFAAGLVALAGCVDHKGVGPEADGPLMVASIFPVADLARFMAGDAVRVTVLLPAGASPATFELTPGQVRALRSASLYVDVGAGLDAWVGEPFPDGAGPVRLTITDGLQLDAAGDQGNDGNPHVWLDPVLVRDHVLPRLADALVEVAPDARERILAGRTALADSLTSLEREIRRALAPLRSRAFLASHPAWTYFARRFQLEELGTVHAGGGSEPSPKALAGLIERARAAGVDVVFAEPQMGETAALALAEELGARVLVLDPLGGEGVAGREGYLRLLRYNAARLAEGLENTP